MSWVKKLLGVFAKPEEPTPVPMDFPSMYAIGISSELPWVCTDWSYEHFIEVFTDTVILNTPTSRQIYTVEAWQMEFRDYLRYRQLTAEEAPNPNRGIYGNA